MNQWNRNMIRFFLSKAGFTHLCNSHVGLVLKRCLKRFRLGLQSHSFLSSDLGNQFKHTHTHKMSSFLFFPPFAPQIVYDEGPLYVFAKSEDVRAKWIKKLKES